MEHFGKKVLIIGDSITEGILGVDYVEMLQNKFQNIQFYNMGLGGDTLQGISDRLLAEISMNMYNIIIIEAGHNDIILPKMREINFLFKLVYKILLKRGSIPTTNSDEFEKKLIQLISKLKTLCEGEIIITTLSCISENLNSDTNQKRKHLNQIIKKIANYHNCVIADVGHVFNEELQDEKTNSKFLDSFFNSFFFDALKTKTIEGAMSLSNKRKLKLTIDGVHINLEGAKIYCNVISDCLNNVEINNNSEI